MQPIDAHVGQRAKLRRQGLGREAAWVARHFGCSVQSVEDWEAGRTRVGGAHLIRLARLLDVPLAWFFADLPPGLAGSGLHERPMLVQDAIALLRSGVPQADPALRERMLDLAGALERTARQQDQVGRQARQELDQLLARWRPAAPGGEEDA